ncbi:MAG: outer rane lipoprotein LolB [Pseudomonadota bacterium]
MIQIYPVKLLGLIGLLILAGCAAPTRLPPPSPEQQVKWQQLQLKLAKIEVWQLRGRMSIHSGDDSWIANVLWEQQPTNYQLQLNTPTGQGVLRLTGAAQQVSLRTAEGDVFNAATAEELLSERLHVNLPVSYLYSWIRGLPVDKVEIDNYQLDNTGRLSLLQQADWTIHYERYQPVKGVSLPSKLALENQAFKVKIVISLWEI